MRGVVQRVSSAKVEIGGQDVGSIGAGLLLYLGVGKGDNASDSDWMLRKVLALRIFENAAGKMDQTIFDVSGSLLVVSQFTLYGSIAKGNRPSFEGAMSPDDARAMYEQFVAAARAKVPVATGQFGADMNVFSVNSGPVTLWLDSKETGRA